MVNESYPQIENKYVDNFCILLIWFNFLSSSYIRLTDKHKRGTKREQTMNGARTLGEQTMNTPGTDREQTGNTPVRAEHIVNVLIMLYK